MSTPGPLHESAEQFEPFLRTYTAGETGLVVEIRALKMPNGNYPEYAECGFFDLDAPTGLRQALGSYLKLPATKQPMGIFLTVNPVLKDLLGRANNRMKKPGKGEKLSADNEHIVRRRWFVIDVDPERLREVCSTEAERESARVVADGVLADLSSRGWPEPMQIDSGNGIHLWYAIDLPTKDDALVASTLKSLSRKHSTDTAVIDTKVFDPARIMRLPGSWNRKGDSIPTRPHRMVKVLKIPDAVVVVEREKLEAVAAAYPPDELAASKTTAKKPSPVKPTSTDSMKLTATDNRLSRCRAYLAKLPAAVEGEYGSDQTFQAARIIWNDFGIDEAEGWPLLCEWNTRCKPPWPEEGGNQCLRRKWNEAVEKGPDDRGSKLKEDLSRRSDTSNSAAVAYPRPRPGELWSDPHRLARLFADKYRHQECFTIAQWRDEFHLWNGAAWSPMPDSDLDAKLARHCRDVFVADFPQRVEDARAAGERAKPPSIYAVTTAVKSNTRLNLAGQRNHPDTGIDAPFWLPGADPVHDPEDVISAPNGLFTLDDIASGRGAFALPTPLFFTPNALTFPVPDSAPEPTIWLRCLDEWFSGDAASIAGLQEWFAYLLSGRTEAHKVLFIVGPQRSGKGTIIRVLLNLVGTLNVASTTFTALGENFGLENLLNKRVALIPDARLGGRTDTAAIVERLLSISGEDPQSVNRKNRTRVTTRLRTRFVLASNEIPRLPDASGALASRFYILHTPNSWLGKEDINLGAKLAPELPGILHWAAAGWVRFQQQSLRFTPNDKASQYHRELGDLSSPVKAFVRQCCKIGPEEQVEIPIIFAAWVRWNEQRKREVAPEGMFGKDLRAACPHLRVTQPRDAEGKRIRTYMGIGLKPEIEWGEDENDANLARVGTRVISTQCVSEKRMENLEYVSPARVPTRASDPAGWLCSLLSSGPLSLADVRSAAAANSVAWEAVVEVAGGLVDEIGGLEEVQWKLLGGSLQ